MDRRELLRFLAFTATGASVGFSLATNKTVAGDKKETHWGYVGQGGPENWGQLSPEYEVCQIGNTQSPINLESHVAAELKTLELSYKPSPIEVVHNGHTIQVNYASGNQLKLEGQTFNLIQFHFHHPSEHQHNGKSYMMEVHLVHQSEDKNLAVLGVFIQPGKENRVLKTIWDELPSNKGATKKLENVTLNPKDLLPQNASFYRYFGSLTTPPCSESVHWIVYDQPIEMSLGQIKKFAQMFPNNSRPIQAINRRFLLRGN